MGYVAAFLGGMVFASFVLAAVIWCLSRRALPPDQCPECDGTGERLRP